MIYKEERKKNEFKQEERIFINFSVFLRCKLVLQQKKINKYI